MTDSRLVEDFARDGVVLVRDLLDSDDRASLRDALARYESGVRALPPSDYTLEPDGKSVQGNSYALRAPPAPGEFVRFQPELRPGDALVHHALTIHGSPPNQSEA